MGVYRVNEEKPVRRALALSQKETGKVVVMAKTLACSSILQNALLHMEQGNAALANSSLKALVGCPCDKNKNKNCIYADDCAVQDVIEGFHQIQVGGGSPPSPARAALSRIG